MMTTNIQKLLKLTFVSLFFVLAACSSDDDKAIVEDEWQNAEHIYDIVLKRGDETITYSATVAAKHGIGIYEVNENGTKILNLWIQPDDNLNILGSIVLDANDVPINFDYDVDEDSASFLHIMDKSKPDYFVAASGSAVISNLKIGPEHPDTVGPLARFTVNFGGVFHHYLPSGEFVEYEFNGKIVVSPNNL